MKDRLVKNGKSIWDQGRVRRYLLRIIHNGLSIVITYKPRTLPKEIILDGGMGALLSSVEVDSSPIWSGIANINSRGVVIDAHQVELSFLRWKLTS